MDVLLALHTCTTMDSSLLQNDEHGICDEADSETNLAQKIKTRDGRMVGQTVKSNDLAKILDHMKISKTLNLAVSEGEETNMQTLIDDETETIPRAKSYTYPKQPSNKSRFAIRKGSTTITLRALRRGPSKILRRPREPAQRAQLDHKRRARWRAFRREMHLSIADAETSITTLNGMTDEQLARTQEELLASAGVTRKLKAVPLPPEATSGDGIGDVSEKLEVCSMGEPAAQDQSTRS
jgi:hypothetical protein